MLKKLLSGILIFFIIFMNANILRSYAESVSVTDEKLAETLQKFKSESDEDFEYKISTENKTITITADDVSYIINYDITENPKFSYVMNFKKGMSYDEYKKITEMQMSAPAI